MAQRGLTLIELSIVLVIIGLLAGGVLAGRELIRVAETRRFMSDLDRFRAATYAFRNKYNCLPGDCVNATQFFRSTDSNGNTVKNGNGDGVIGSGGAYFYEAYGIWHHLSLAGLIPGSYTGDYTGGINPGVNTPKSSLFGNTVGLTVYAYWPSTDGPLGTKGAFNVGMAGNTMSTAIWDQTDIRPLDEKFDDGMPYTGTMRIWGSGCSLRLGLPINTLHRPTHISVQSSSISLTVDRDP